MPLRTVFGAGNFYFYISAMGIAIGRYRNEFNLVSAVLRNIDARNLAEIDAIGRYAVTYALRHEYPGTKLAKEIG